MALSSTDLPCETAALKAMRLDRDAAIANLQLTIAKMQRGRFNATSERSRKRIEQMELQLCELETAAAQTRASAEIETPNDADEPRRAPQTRWLFLDHLPRERHVQDALTACHADLPNCERSNGTVLAGSDNRSGTRERVIAAQEDGGIASSLAIRMSRPACSSNAVKHQIELRWSARRPPEVKRLAPRPRAAPRKTNYAAVDPGASTSSTSASAMSVRARLASSRFSLSD